MPHPFQGLEFISPDLQWTPKITGDEKVDYEYGCECAYRYSDAIRNAALEQKHHNLIQMNETFRASIDPSTPAGRGFQKAIIGR